MSASTSSSSLWRTLLPVIQEINDYGGNFISIFLSRSIVDAIDERAALGDATLDDKRTQMRRIIQRGKWPYDPNAFNALFETYHEALFYLLADNRGVTLAGIAEKQSPTPDFETVSEPKECFEIKTIDFTGGQFAYDMLTEDALDGRITAQQAAKKRGIGTSTHVVSPHGDAKDTKEAIERVMRQIGGNVKQGQFAQHPTFLVTPMTRTALRRQSEELEPTRYDRVMGGTVSGHLWSIAAHQTGDSFFDATLDAPAHDMGALDRAGILRDFPFIRGIIFINTEWNQLGSADIVDDTVLTKAYQMLGIWNDAYVPVARSASSDDPEVSTFSRICHVWRCFSDS